MKLVVIDNEGIVWDITDDLEGYDLSKPMAASSIIGDIQSVLEDIAEDEA